MRAVVLLVCWACVGGACADSVGPSAGGSSADPLHDRRLLDPKVRGTPRTSGIALARGPMLRPTDGEDEALEERYEPLDTASEAEPVDDAVPSETDVLVIGSGPAGIAAALAARESGLDVLVLDRADRAGTGIIYGGRFLAVGTPYQEAAGVTDSVDLAASEWESLTGVDGGAEAVQTFLEGSAETLAWMETYGLAVEDVNADPDAGELQRVHTLDGPTSRTAILAAFDGTLRTGIEVQSLLMEDGRVVGVGWEDQDTGETGSTSAGAVVVATGGFVRDPDRVLASRPELAARDLLWETNPESDGGGIAFLEEAGAAFENEDSLGIYVHAIQDPELADGEALIMGSPSDHLIVDRDGQRIDDEDMARSLHFFDELPDGDVFLLTTEERAAELRMSRPAYNWAVADSAESFALTELDTLSDDVFAAASLSELGALIDVDGDALTATVDGVNGMIVAGETDSFGRDFSRTDLYESDTWWAARITPGLAKAFGGVATNLEGEVLDEDGEVIPGLFAAGEVVGMIPQGGAGSGFAGSVGACYTYGRITGTQAAGLVISSR